MYIFVFRLSWAASQSPRPRPTGCSGRRSSWPRRPGRLRIAGSASIDWWVPWRTVQGKWSWVPRPVRFAGQTARSESESGAGWGCSSYGGKWARCHTRSFQWDTTSVQLLRNETVQTCNCIQVDSRGTDRHNQVDQVKVKDEASPQGWNTARSLQSWVCYIRSKYVIY